MKKWIVGLSSLAAVFAFQNCQTNPNAGLSQKETTANSSQAQTSPLNTSSPAVTSTLPPASVENIPSSCSVSSDGGTPYCQPALLVQTEYRLYNGKNHLISSSSSEATSLGFHLEGAAFRIFLTLTETAGNDYPDFKVVTLYRCLVPGSLDHFISADPKCEGQTNEATYGFALTSNALNTQPLYRLYNSIIGDHLMTVAYSEVLSAELLGYHLEGILGYVLPVIPAAGGPVQVTAANPGQ